MTKFTKVMTSMVVVALAVVLSGCGLTKNNSITVDMTKEDSTEERPGVVLTGTVVKVGEKFFLRAGGGDTEIASRKVDLAPFVEKSVEARGEFSGTTLYLDSIK